MNKWIGTGRLVRDPELRMSQSGVAVCNFTVAVDRRFKQENGPTADFISCIAFQKTAEFVNKYFGKGKMIAVEGRIQTRNWEDDGGKKHYKTEILTDAVEFCGGKSEDGSPVPDAGAKKASASRSPAAEEISEDSDDLPF